MTTLSQTASLILAELHRVADGLTVHQVTRRTGHGDGRVIRVALDDLVHAGYLEYAGGQGNNRRYLVVQVTA